MSKNFTSIPKRPSASAPPPEAIAAFERGGIGQDNQRLDYQSSTQTHIPTNVDSGGAKAEPTRRLSIDLPASKHRRFKQACAGADTKMVVEVMEFIDRRTLELEKLAVTLAGDVNGSN